MERCDQVEEIQGLYGPFSVSERLIQGIWARQDLLGEDFRTENGHCLKVVDPGQWNFNEGPDFLEARLLVDGREIVGAVEIHFYVEDWWAHQHACNPNFNGVVLHVVLFPPTGRAKPAMTQFGEDLDTLVMLPYLERDLESYAMDRALMALEAQDTDEWVAGFVAKDDELRVELLEAAARKRWLQKRAFICKRLTMADWSEVCHQMALEVLGYARNRAPMSRIALRHPLSEMKQLDVSAEVLFASEASQWRLNGLRPANHPKKRLGQYLEVLRLKPDWPELLIDWAKRLPEFPENCSTRAFRQAVGLSALVEDLSETVFGGVIPASRLNTLCCDTLFPLITEGGFVDAWPLWRHGHPGDLPDGLKQFLKKAGLTHREEPYSNGRLQGALSLSLTRGESTDTE